MRENRLPEMKDTLIHNPNMISSRELPVMCISENECV